MGVMVCLFRKITDSLKDWLTWADPCQRTRCGVEGQRKQKGEAPFVRDCRKAHRNLPGSSDLSRPRKERSGFSIELRFRSTRGSARLVDEGGWLALELGARFGLLCSPAGLYRTHYPFSVWITKWSLADMPDCPCCGSGLEETAEHAFYYSKLVRPIWNHIEE